MMNLRIFISVLMTVAALSFCTGADGQTKAVSSVWSLSGIGIGYEHYYSDDDYFQMDIKAMTDDIFIKEQWNPEVSVSMTWNMVFAERISDNGNRIYFYAGPGAVGGWCRDYKAQAGAIFGFKGRLGAECTFASRHVSICASLSPELAMHICRKNGGTYMRLYRHGIIFGLLPEIGIKYAF